MAQAMADGYLRYSIVTDIYGPMNLSHISDIFSLLYLHKNPVSCREKSAGGGFFVENFFLLNLGVCVIISPESSFVSERTGECQPENLKI